jgi:hypothetical protein
VADLQTRFHNHESGNGVPAGARWGGMSERFRSKNEKNFLKKISEKVIQNN